MKKLLIAVFSIGIALHSHAQETTFKPFKVDLALGYAIPSGSGAKGGIIIAMEPKYALNDNIAVGLRLEGALMVRASIDASGEAVEGEAKYNGSYLLTGDYYFTTTTFRPFAGIGAGLYRIAAASFDEEDAEDIQRTSKFGFAPRVGFEVGHFRTALEYNIAGKSGTINNNYLGIKMGFFIGGGRY